MGHRKLTSQWKFPANLLTLINEDIYFLIAPNLHGCLKKLKTKNKNNHGKCHIGVKNNGKEIRENNISPSLGHCLLANTLFQTLAKTSKLFPTASFWVLTTSISVLGAILWSLKIQGMLVELIKFSTQSV